MRCAASVTVLKLPPTTTVWPTSASAYTVPSCTCGVKSTGLSETTRAWAVSATAGTAPATATAASAAATISLRCIRWDSSDSAGDTGSNDPPAIRKAY